MGNPSGVKGLICSTHRMNLRNTRHDLQAREGKAYFKLGIVYKSRMDFPKAIECYEKSLNIAREAGDRATERDASLDFGVV